MNLRILVLVALAWLGLSVPGGLLAGTIRHDQLDSSYLALAMEPQFAAAGAQFIAGGLLCSATLISPEWVVTAAHCVDRNGDGVVDNPTGTGNSFRTSSGAFVSVTEIHVPTGWDGNISHGRDIAVMRLATPVTDITPVPIYRGTGELGATISLIGTGRTGNGQTGSVLAAGTTRAGQNTVDAFGRFTGSNGIDFTTVDSATATSLAWEFDSPVTDPQHALTNTMSSEFGVPSSDVPLGLEYLMAPGDSGGGGYIFENGSWWLAAVLSGDSNAFNYPGATESTNRSTYGDVNVATRVSSFQGFIDGFVPIPEPAPFWSGLTIALGLTSIRRLFFRRLGRGARPMALSLHRAATN